jgi:exodeoxyribonuclease VII large subunit
LRPPVRTAVVEAEPSRVIWTVSDLTFAIKEVLQEGFARVVVRGEVSGFRGANARGHLYFALKDAEASVDAKVWVSTAQKLKFRLKDGMELIAEGYLDLYAPQGRYSLIVQSLEPVGEGALALAFLQLKERLTAEGLMGDRRRRPPRPLPFLPRRIGVVTSRTGAALHDFLRVLHGRHPRLSVLVCHAKVQGPGSADEVVSALGRLARTDVDVIVVTRGGGSVEDLWTFNEESVARAIHACPVPVVSAIGHEVDFTIADFVADYRAPTPSAAAERLAPVLKDLALALSTHERRLAHATHRRVLMARQRLLGAQRALLDPRRLLGRAQLGLAEDTERLVGQMRRLLRQRSERLKGLSERLARQQPLVQLKAHERELALLREKLGQQLHRKLADRRRHFHSLAGGLERLSPLKVMTRGYAVAFRAEDGHLVRSAKDVSVGGALTLKLAPGHARSLEDCEEIDATVTSVRHAF